MTESLTHFTPDPKRLRVLRECMENYDVGVADAEWPNNVLSRQTVVYSNGVIARADDVIEHHVEVAELERCRQQARYAEALMDGCAVGMGSESSDLFQSFFIVANIGTPVPSRIDDDLIRAKFAGTLFPGIRITVEPLREEGVWWREVSEDYADVDHDPDSRGNKVWHLKPWRRMIAFFNDSPDLLHPVFVRIGSRESMEEIPVDQYPPGTEISGCVFPRLALGLTPKGSLVGIAGFSVQT